MTNAPPFSSSRSRTRLSSQVLFGLAALLTMLPVFSVRYLPLVDLAGHLGRIQILNQYASDPALQARYEVIHRPLPNLALDALLLFFNYFLSMEDAARAFVLMEMLVFIAGCAALSYSFHGRLVPLASVALFLQYNSMFFYGFVAFQLGVGLFLLTLALWYRWREQWTPGRLLVLCGMSILTYFGHLAGYMFLGLSISVLLVTGALRLRRIPWRVIAGSAVMTVPMGLYLSLGAGRGDTQAVMWSTFTGKLRHGLVLLIGYDMVVDVSLGLVLVVAGVLVSSVCKPRLHATAGILAAAFWLGFLAAPSVYMNGSDADARFVLPAGVFTLLAVQFSRRPRMAQAAFVLAGAVCIIRLGSIAWAWRQQNSLLLDSQIALFENIPRKARVYPIFEGSSDARENKFERPLYHFISWATVHRDAIVPTNFTIRGQHPVVERAGFWFREVPFDETAAAFEWGEVFQNFDIIWFYGTNSGVLEKLESRCRIIALSGKARLYQVLPPTP